MALDVGRKLDILSRTIALQRTHKRIEDFIRPIAGSQVTCDNADLCAYLNHYLDDATSEIVNLLQSGSDIRLELDWVWGVLGGPSSNDPINYPLSGNVHDDLTTITTRIGPEYSDHLNVFDLLHDIKPDATTAATEATTAANNTVTIEAALPYPNSQATDVHADINRAIASILLGNALSDLIKDAVGTITDPIGTLLQTIEIAFPNHSGGTQVVNYNTNLVEAGQPPPVQSLTQGTTQSLGTGADVTIPTGTYGYLFSFTVPSYWAQRGFFAEDLSPSIAILDWYRDAYSFNNPKYVRRDNWLAWPLHPAANRFTIDLAPGVTGTYTPLVL